LLKRVLIATGLVLVWAACTAGVCVWKRSAPLQRPQDPFAILEVETNPPGASVRIDPPDDSGVYARGVAPCTFRLSAESDEALPWVVHVEKAGYKATKRELTLRRGEQQAITLDLPAIANWVRPKSAREIHEVTITAVGDILLGQVKDPFGDVRTALTGADVTFGNLECPLTTATELTSSKSKQDIADGEQYVFKAHPRWANDLALAGFDVLSIANNHTVDYRAKGLTDTIAALKQHGIKPVGAGANQAEARSLRIVSVGNVQVGFLAASTIVYPGYGATPSGPGVAAHKPGDPERWLTETVAAAKRKVDILCVSIHWGIERQDQPTAYQKKIAEACARAGASFVIGHHPHCLQPTEVVNGCLVVYSLGNFVGLGTDAKTMQSVILTASFEEGKLRWYEQTPIRIVGHRPTIAGEPKRTGVNGKREASAESAS
jgi:poly-gamma-glutamate capsule biosynthesis protein CapA/YwtB (metallophosphatase superfamily)